MTQLVGRAQIEIVYRRPVAHGRALYGALVPWGKIWTPSADSAARLRVNVPIEVNGAQLAAGEYSVWAIPDAKTWTVIFNSVAATFHLTYPQGRDVLRVQATPTTGDYMETLGFYFPMVDADSAVLRMHWGTTIVPLTIRAKSP